ncbi:MAG: U32 family peptidase [Firmicutes bacterium]|nr:U32 family peptidase [Bacillota bacterium]
MTPELLAPAGSPEALLAAIRCGADAVYLGGGAFNARAGAKNFSRTALPEAGRLCKLHNVKLYFTLNTLLTDRELQQAMALAEEAIEAGADAIIVQDLGLLRLLHIAYPALPLHASTQCSTQTAQGMALLKELGASRCIVPRELTREELAALAASAPLEPEAFVHGALCMSVSGQCLLSFALGGRSGNRGACAQPCRLPWAVDSGQRTVDSYSLSLKDLSLLEEVNRPPLNQMAALKIEGRQKRPEYVAAAVTAFRRALDGTMSPVSGEDLRRTFSRSGFTKGYYKAQRDKSMFGVRRKEDAAPPDTLRRMAALYAKDTPRVALEERLCANSAPTRIDNAPQRQLSTVNCQLSTVLRFLSPAQIPHALPEHAQIFLPCDTPPEVLSKHRAQVVIPAGVFGDYDKILARLRRAKQAGAALAMAQTLDGIALAHEAGLVPIAGEGMNLLNSASLEALQALGAAGAVLSAEITPAQVRDLRAQMAIGAMVYGRLALMLCRNCPVKAQIGCKACGAGKSLIDRKGAAFPLRCENGCAKVYNSRPLWLADVQGKLPTLSFRLFSFTIEGREECASVLRAYQNGEACKGEFTRGWLR